MQERETSSIESTAFRKLSFKNTQMFSHTSEYLRGLPTWPCTTLHGRIKGKAGIKLKYIPKKRDTF